MKNIPQDIIDNRLSFIDHYIAAQNAAQRQRHTQDTGNA